MICGIYIIEFKTPVWGWYVGQSQDVESRWKQHKKKAADGTH
jgi:predicted GIY-YIG superfamily endonuclease